MIGESGVKAAKFLNFPAWLSGPALSRAGGGGRFCPALGKQSCGCPGLLSGGFTRRCGGVFTAPVPTASAAGRNVVEGPQSAVTIRETVRFICPDSTLCGERSVFCARVGRVGPSRRRSVTIFWPDTPSPSPRRWRRQPPNAPFRNIAAGRRLPRRRSPGWITRRGTCPRPGPAGSPGPPFG